MSEVFDFDNAPDRLAWSASKWEKYRGRDVIPLWIADMDFAVAPAIRNALSAQVAAGDFGYLAPPRELPGELADYYSRHYGWAIDPAWIVWLPGLVLGLNLAVRACCAEAGSALTFSPVYPPFLSAAPNQGRRTLAVPLALASSGHTLRYRIDFAALESALQPDTGLLLLCQPHNPVGTLFGDDELARLADFCVAHDLHVCSDEVHCDLILDGSTPHRPFAPLLAARDEATFARSITLHGPGKTYNLAGLGIAWAIIPDAGLRRRYRAQMAHLVPSPSGLGYTALRAALSEGEPWRQALLAALRARRDRVCAVLDELGLAHTQPEFSFLIWIDARTLAARVGNPAKWLEGFGLGLSDGADFGAPGFLRLNFAAPLALLETALERLRRALRSLG